MNKKTIYVRGMHCVACEKLLEEELLAVPFVKKIEADRKKGEVKIYFGEREPNSLAIKEIVKKIGYEASEKPWGGSEVNKKQKTTWTEDVFSVLIVLVILLIFRIFQNYGFIPEINASSSNISFGIALLVGMVASVSSCLAVVGAVIIAFSEKYRTIGGSFYEGSVRPNLFFHIGRLGTFFLLGGTLGFVGGELNISGSFVSFYMIFIAVVMAILALNILGVAPSISSFGVAMPKILTKHWARLKDSNHTAAPFVLGGLSFFLPCGFTQSMQLFALASGSFWAGGLSLFFFALGTVPVLMALGVATSWTKNRKIAIFQKVAGILILIFAVYTFSSGLAIWGLKGNLFGRTNQAQNSPNASANSDASSSVQKSQVPASENVQVVDMHVTNSGFSPNVLKIKKGIPVRWVIKGDQLTSCTNKIIVPSLNLQKDLGSGDNIVTFTAQKTGDLLFSCWMGMVRGKFVVE